MSNAATPGRCRLWVGAPGSGAPASSEQPATGRGLRLPFSRRAHPGYRGHRPRRCAGHQHPSGCGGDAPSARWPCTKAGGWPRVADLDLRECRADPDDGLDGLDLRWAGLGHVGSTLHRILPVAPHQLPLPPCPGFQVDSRPGWAPTWWPARRSPPCCGWPAARMTWPTGPVPEGPHHGSQADSWWPRAHRECPERCASPPGGLREVLENSGVTPKRQAGATVIPYLISAFPGCTGRTCAAGRLAAARVERPQDSASSPPGGGHRHVLTGLDPEESVRGSQRCGTPAQHGLLSERAASRSGARGLRSPGADGAAKPSPAVH